MADSIRDALSAAYSAAEKEPELNLPDTSGDVPDPPAPGNGDGDDSSADTDLGEPENKEGVVAPTSNQPPGQGTPPQTAPTAQVASDPAPASWKAEEKAAWTALPAEAKAAIRRREADTQRALSTSSSARKMEASFQTAMTPYQTMLEKHQVKDPIREVVAPILEIRRILEEGTDQQRAHAVYNMIKQFKVDVNTLDEYLVNGPGQVAPIQPPQQQVNYREVPELKPIFEIADERKAAEEAKLDEMIASVASEPHFEELREDTAAVLKSFGEKGISISLKDAYNRALLLRPDLSPITPPAPTEPARGADGKFVAANLDASRKAAKSVSGAPKSTPGAKPSDLRGDLEAAFESVG